MKWKSKQHAGYTIKSQTSQDSTKNYTQVSEIDLIEDLPLGDDGQCGNLIKSRKGISHVNSQNLKVSKDLILQKLLPQSQDLPDKLSNISISSSSPEPKPSPKKIDIGSESTRVTFQSPVKRRMKLRTKIKIRSNQIDYGESPKKHSYKNEQLYMERTNFIEQNSGQKVLMSPKVNIGVKRSGISVSKSPKKVKNSSKKLNKVALKKKKTKNGIDKERIKERKLMLQQSRYLRKQLEDYVTHDVEDKISVQSTRRSKTVNQEFICQKLDQHEELVQNLLDQYKDLSKNLKKYRREHALN